jgi:cytosine/adenosine deaminase-related metal-dependent hydrolase
VRWGHRWRWQLNAPRDRSPYVFHVGEGTSPAARDEIDELIRWNLFRRSLVGVHAIAMHREQAEGFRAIVWCPVSNESLYGATADVASLKSGTAVLFGTDSTLTAAWNFWDHLRRARVHRGLDDRELFDAVTCTAARVWQRPGRGRIATGQVADFVVARKKARDPWDAFFAVNPEDILLVVREGNVILRDASLDVGPLAAPFSIVRLRGTEKLVAEDVPEILAAIRRYGIEPNVPLDGTRDRPV